MKSLADSDFVGFEPLPRSLTDAKTPPCTALISDPAGVLRDRGRWPAHVCYEEFFVASCKLWAEKHLSIVEDMAVHRWAAMHPLPIGRQSLLTRLARSCGVGELEGWPEVHSVLPFDGGTLAFWALRIERRNLTHTDTLDLFGLAEYPTEAHQGRRFPPVAGELAYVLRGRGTSLLDVLDPARRWWGQFHGLAFPPGRPKGTGTWESPEHFEAELRRIVPEMRSEGIKITQENVAERLYTNDTQIRRWCKRLGPRWEEVKKF